MIFYSPLLLQTVTGATLKVLHILMNGRMKAGYRKINDHTRNSSTYHKKDGTNVRAKLKEELEQEVKESLEKDMNERIRELYNQACRLDMEQYPNAIPDGERIQQKFAELIVKECAQFVEDKFDFIGEEIIVKEKMLEHFGVEE